MEININDISAKKKLIIEKGLCDYKYITDHWKDNDSDFQSVFYEFYLKARWAVMSDKEKQKAYFEKMHEKDFKEDIVEVVKFLKTKTGYYEFSLASKMLHTVNPKWPIYDRKVREYLTKERGIKFEWNCNEDRDSDLILDLIRKDWDKLIGWYEDFIPSATGQKWIEWFDSNFESYKDMVKPLKKIDFIIFATQ